MKKLGKLNASAEDSIIMFACSCSCYCSTCPSCGCVCTGTSAPINGGYAAMLNSSTGASSGISYSNKNTESRNSGIG